jgi:PIN like domain
MPPAPPAIRWFVDESLLGIGKILARARRDVVHPGHPSIPTVQPGDLDEDWLAEVGRLGLVIIGRDRRIRTRPGEVALIKAHALRVFRIAGKRDLGNWGYLVRLIMQWERMEGIVEDWGPGPWFMAVYETRIREIPLPP